MSYVHCIATAVPPHVYSQEFAAERMKMWVSDRVMRRMVHRVYRQSGIERRHSVLPDFQPGAKPLLFRERADGTLVEPTTGQRNFAFQQYYPAVAREALFAALAAAPWVRAADITHVITATCTGFCNPGPDLFVVTELGLAQSVERYHLGFI